MIALQLDNTRPIRQQVYTQLRDAILARRFAAGTQLPPSRSLATELGISRNSVLHAYEQLTSEGYLTARGGAGTFVAEIAQPPVSDVSPPGAGGISAVLSDYGRRLQNEVPAELFQRGPRPRLRYDFAYGEPAYDGLPIEVWARIVGRTARRLMEKQLSYAPHAGVDELRQAVAGYLSRSRGVSCNAEQVIIVQGTQEAIDLSVRLLVNRGDLCVVEEPHYRGFRRCLLAAGAAIYGVEADGQGLQTSRMRHIRGARLACVTPSHQFPAGGILPLQRRLELLDWAQHHRTMILEDDYDGEFRYRQRPMPSLQSLDTHGTVIYVGTSSKIFFPALRIAWMVVPAALREPLLTLKAMADIWPSTLEQLAFAQLINDGHLERHIHKVRRLLAGKRTALLTAVREHLGNRVSAVGSDAGIHVLLRLHTLQPQQVPELINRCAAQHTGIYAAAPFYLQPPAAAELILGYSGLTEAQIRSGIKRLAVEVAALS